MKGNQAREGNEEVSNAQVYCCPFDCKVRPPHASYTELKVEIPGQVSLRPRPGLSKEFPAKLLFVHTKSLGHNMANCRCHCLDNNMARRF
jgi:hypothetical protein